jgi:hypothetical protein
MAVGHLRGLTLLYTSLQVRVWRDRCDEEGEPTLEIRTGIPLSVDSWKDGKGFAVGVEDGSVRIW